MRDKGLVLCMLVALAQSATSAEIKILSPGALRSTLMEVVPTFEKETGHSVQIQYAAAGPLAGRISKGEVADVAILSRADVDRLVKDGLIRGGDNPDIARVGIGVMVRKGAQKPDISNVDNLKAALRSAKTIGIANPTQGAAGAYLAKTFTLWGMDEELKPKIRALTPGDGLYAGVEKGVAEIGFAPVSEILARKDTLELVGPVPADMQSYNLFAAGVLVVSKEPSAAAALLRFLTSAPVAPVLQQNGLEAR